MTLSVRTPDERFESIGWDVGPHYLVHPDGLRQHYVDERTTDRSGAGHLSAAPR